MVEYIGKEACAMDNKSGKKKKLKCYIYTRVSTWMQVDGYSLDAQRNRLIGEAEHRGMIVAREFTDEGKSGLSLKLIPPGPRGSGRGEPVHPFGPGRCESSG